MVLIGRQELFAELRADRALAALITLLFDPEGSVEVPKRISQTTDAVIGVLASLREGKEDGFRQAATMLIRRKVSSESDWIHDDLLAFSMVVGNLRFGGCDELVAQLLRARLSGADDRSQRMSQSLNALSKSQNAAPLASVLIVGRMLAYPARELDGALLSLAHEQSVALEIQPTTQQFLRLIGEKVADVATRVGTLRNASDYSRLTIFRNKFEFRANLFAHAVFWLLLIGVAALWLYVARLYFSPNKESEEFAGKLFQMGVVIGPVVLFFAGNKIRAGIRRLFYMVFGGSGLLDPIPNKSSKSR